MHRLPAPLTTLLLAGLLLALGGASGASAHQLQHVEADSATLDLGTADPARLIHTTLVSPTDKLVVKITMTSEPVEAIMYVPDAEPEQDRPAADLPTITATWPGGGVMTAQDGSNEPVTDAATAISYLELVRAPIAADPGTTATITIRRGAEPTRVALRIGPASPFGAEDFERTPRTLTGVRIWNATPPPGSKSAQAKAADPNSAIAWFGAGIAIAGVLVAIWWIATGRAASRRRGVERALDRKDPHS
jgi:hypothetical protein